MMGTISDIHSIPEDAVKGKAVRYVLERRCSNGGFCFYRLEEPNSSDTFFALSVLFLTGIEYQDKKALQYLKDRQLPDGSYESVFQAYYCVKSLKFFHDGPVADPASFLMRSLDIYDIHLLPAEVTSIFRKMYLLMDTCQSLSIQLSKVQLLKLRRFALQYHNYDGGFGYPCSTLCETMHAVKILQWLDYPLSGLMVKHFWESCQDSVYVFTNVPHTSLAYIEHMHAGIALAETLNCAPLNPGSCLEFIVGCQNRNGGFARTVNGGIATLENSWLAIDALDRLMKIKQKNR